MKRTIVRATGMLSRFRGLAASEYASLPPSIGVCLRPGNQALRFGINLAFPSEQSDEMDALTMALGKPTKLGQLPRASWTRAMKVRRNDLCPGGSGRKCKKCCLL